jgi:hypothetical protein
LKYLEEHRVISNPPDEILRSLVTEAEACNILNLVNQRTLLLLFIATGRNIVRIPEVTDLLHDTPRPDLTLQKVLNQQMTTDDAGILAARSAIHALSRSSDWHHLDP